MIILQRGETIWTFDKTTGKFKQLPLTYTKYPTEPTPESLNEGLAWLLDFLKRRNLSHYTVLVDEEESRGPMETTEIVYADIVQGGQAKHNLAIYTVCTAITTGSTQSLETTLYEELT